MAASKEEISGWFDNGKLLMYSYLIVVCDTYDYEDYPVYAQDAADCKSKYSYYNSADMQRVMEVYDLHQPKQPQLNERRAFHLPGPP